MFNETKCYISGELTPHMYTFGNQQGKNLILPLSQEVFAKFILRAGDDEQHQKIMSDLKILHEELTAVENKYLAAIDDYEVGSPTHDIAELQITRSEKELEFRQLVHEKAVSGFRILKEIKREYED